MLCTSQIYYTSYQGKIESFQDMVTLTYGWYPFKEKQRHFRKLRKAEQENIGMVTKTNTDEHIVCILSYCTTDCQDSW